MRGSGRTTRMLEAANLAASNGFSVWVLAASSQQASQFQRSGILDSKIRVKLAGYDFDWIQLRWVGMPLSTGVFIDHYALELKVAELDSYIDKLLDDLRFTDASLKNDRDELRGKLAGATNLRQKLEDKSHEFDLSNKDIAALSAKLLAGSKVQS